MGFIIKVLLTAVAVYVAAYLIPGVHIADIKTTIIVALILALLNTFIKPILIILTIPITILTLGLFLLILNALMVKWAADLVHYFNVGGFTVDGWWPALLVSLVVTIVTYILESIIERG
jgi:putative membrane protein